MSAAERYRISEARDWRGNLIGEGDTVLYPRQSGYSVEMVEATVVEIWRREQDRRRFVWPPDGVNAYVSEAAYVYKLAPTSRSSRDFGSTNPAPVWIQNGENVTLA